MGQREVYEYLKKSGKWHTNEQLSKIFKTKQGNISCQTMKLAKNFKEIDFSDHRTAFGHRIKLYRYIKK